MTRQIDFDAVHSFVVFAEELNFTKAAAKLHISQPALFTKIQKLSDSLNRPLYERSGRNLRLTKVGADVARLGREAKELSDGFLDELVEGERKQPVVLAAGEGAYLYLIGHSIKEYVRKSGASLRLLTRDGPSTLDAVRAGLAHVGVAVLEVLPTDVETEVLAKVPEILAVPRGHPLSRRSSIKLRDLREQSLIVPPTDRPHRMATERALRAVDVRWNVALEATGWELMLRFVQMGLGVAIVNGCCDLPAGVVGIRMPELPETCYYVMHRKKAAAKAAILDLKKHLLAGTSSRY